MNEATNKIYSTNGFRAIKSLQKAAADPRVEEIEGEGMDEGRVFIHLTKGYRFGGGHDTHSFSVGSVQEIRNAFDLIEEEN